MTELFFSSVDLLQICAKSVALKSADAVRIIEQYHQSILCTYSIIQNNFSGNDADIAFQMSFKVVNDYFGPDGLVLALLAYRALSWLGLSSDQLSPSITARAIALRNATVVTSKRLAKGQL